MAPFVTPDPASDPVQGSDLDVQRQALAETRARIAAMESLLEELPALFEAKFHERLAPLLQQQQQLLSDNHALRHQLEQLQGDTAPRRHLRALGSPLRLATAPAQLTADGGALPRDGSADPTHR